MRKILPVLVLGLVLVTACGKSEDKASDATTSSTAAANTSQAATSSGTTSPPEPAAAVTVDESANGTELQMVPGQRLVVRLKSNPSTGYSWGIQSEDQSILMQDGEPGYEQDPGPSMPGKGGTAVWAFRAITAGTTTLEMVYARPWEPASDANQKFALTVKVQ
ncbi:protease inhibitor I42 family protein [Nocardia huaxiensis]|uniref:Protease inhibitor I42 family protein n=1 Tax=Nocardia huaxiensis TaxID=2755382 RepID=A0A7D6VD66_9NOCA|nr:protease inhibitor I42 family protein [Nocardia huaxiensis]QLY30097.1 protease inhibitor I42 family protein [Nocardia huaxiensis]